jgi:hypothetical protein
MWLPRSVDPAGDIWSTTRDVLRYARCISGTHRAALTLSVVTVWG